MDLVAWVSCVAGVTSVVAFVAERVVAKRMRFNERLQVRARSVSGSGVCLVVNWRAVDAGLVYHIEIMAAERGVFIAPMRSKRADYQIGRRSVSLSMKPRRGDAEILEAMVKIDPIGLATLRIRIFESGRNALLTEKRFRRGAIRTVSFLESSKSQMIE
jgi:hypothetical protein